MAIRKVGIVVDPDLAAEAATVTIRRSIGGEKLILLDPFLLLDHLSLSPEDGGEDLGFPRHPHRGIETLTYVYRGKVNHKDSLGNSDTIGIHGSQWMTAGKGIFHEEMLVAGEDGNESLQLWFNLPADKKFIPAAYRSASSDHIPLIELNHGATARLVAGSLSGQSGPLDGIAVQPLVADIQLAAGANANIPVGKGKTTYAYVVEGEAKFGEEGSEKAVHAPQLAIFRDGDDVRVVAGDSGARFLLVSAHPLNQPVMQYRSLVMNTVDQMSDALEQLEEGTFA